MMDGEDEDYCDCEDEEITSDQLSAENNGDEFLFTGSRMKVQELVLLILTYASTCRLSGVALSNLLRLIEPICPLNSNCRKSLKDIKIYKGNANASEKPFVLHLGVSKPNIHVTAVGLGARSIHSFLRFLY